MYISPERKVSTVPGTGVQYIPWHDENFIDYVVENFLPRAGEILDLGGGGFRFAIPVALREKSVIVVDLDEAGLDIENIVKRSNEFGKFHIKFEEVVNFITIKRDDIFSFLEHNGRFYQLITAFRLIHFFSPALLEKFFSLVTSRLEQNGIFAFSGVTPYNVNDKENFNEIFLNSSAFDKSNPLYRKFNDSSEANAIRDKQNLAEFIHLIDEQFIDYLVHKYNFSIIASEIASTKIVVGYVLKKI